MRYLIIGLGIYGSNLATDLTDMGHEVIGADINPITIEGIKDKISTVYTLDSTEESALAVLPLKAVDLVIVAIGENFGASVKTVAILRKMGVKAIYARAVDDIHQTILEGFKVDRILIPEQRAARELTRELAIGPQIDAMRIDRDTYVLKFKIPEIFVGLTLSEAEFEKRYGMKLIALSRPVMQRNMIGVPTPIIKVKHDATDNTVLEKDDELTVMATQKQFKEMLGNT